MYLDEAKLALQAALGEDSTRRFLPAGEQVQDLASEIAALANSGGGKLFWGLTEEGRVEGLSREFLPRANRLLQQAAESLRPPVAVRTQNIPLAGERLVIIVDVPAANPPCLDSNGRCWVKVAAGRLALSPQGPGAGELASQCTGGDGPDVPSGAKEGVFCTTANDSSATGGEAVLQPCGNAADTGQKSALAADFDQWEDGGGQSADEEITPALTKKNWLFSANSSEGREAKEVYRLIKNDINVTTENLALHLGISKRTVIKRVALLKELGVLVRHGSSRGGRWEIVVSAALAAGLDDSDSVDEAGESG